MHQIICRCAACSDARRSIFERRLDPPGQTSPQTQSLPSVCRGAGFTYLSALKTNSAATYFDRPSSCWIGYCS
eukprot:2068281-Pyramimonas_sp.AAC.1